MHYSKILVVLFFLVFQVFSNPPEISTKLGKIRGLILTNVDGSTYEAYRGIPYAKKLTETTKFLDSEPVEPWDKPLNASKFESTCISHNLFINEIVGDVDCLYMNVYVPQNRSKNESLKSMLWIHGGSFVFGSGDDYGPDYLIKENVILVTFNYRVGPFGFLNAALTSCPGNMGLKDQNRAIRFYKEILAKPLGADPEDITIFGQSAGGASVSYHILSPMSKGLIQKAIINSGTSEDVWAYNDDPTYTIKETAKILNLKSKDIPGIIKELTEEWTTKEILNKIKIYLDDEEGGFVLKPLLFIPSKEEKLEGCEQFLPDDPLHMLKTGNFNTVPTMIGITSDEGMPLVKEMLQSLKKYIKNPNENNKVIPFIKRNYDERIELLIPKMFEYYTGNPDGSGASLAQETMMSSDSFFNFGYWTTINFLAKYNVPTYAYYFQYRIEGACIHGDDLKYIFYMNAVSNIYEKDTPKYKLMSKFTKMWTSFAKNGNPTPDNSGLTKWEKYNVNKRVLTIDNDLNMASIKDLGDNFPARMCWLLSIMKKDIQKSYEEFNLC